MINLLSEQRRQIVQAATTLAPVARLAFIHDVEAALAEYCMGRAPSNMAVQRCIEMTMDAAPWPRSNNSIFMCESIPEQEASVTRQQQLDFDDDQFETKMIDGRPVRILKDGGRMSFGLFAMDQADKILKDTVAAMDKQPVLDAAAHRPGHRLSRDAYARDEVIAAYHDYNRELTSAWQGNPPSGQGSTGFVEKTGEGKAGDSCTLDGNRGTLQYVDGELVCVPDGRHERYKGKDGATMQRDHAQRMSEIYAAHDRTLEAAWRGGKT
jgi:hypothetical protein